MVAGFALLGDPHALPWRLSAYAGAAPITAMATRQLAENSLCLIFPSVSGRAAPRTRNGYTMSTGIWFNDVPGVLDYGAEANFVVLN
jgi:hypothetical protein